MRLPGQKGSKKLHKVAPGLWNAREMGFHEHGLVHRGESELSECRETYRSLTQGSSYLAQGKFTSLTSILHPHIFMSNLWTINRKRSVNWKRIFYSLDLESTI